MADNARLRRASVMDRVIYWTCLCIVVGFSIYKFNGGTL
jgi:hypothetical protein